MHPSCPPRTAAAPRPAPHSIPALPCPALRRAPSRRSQPATPRLSSAIPLLYRRSPPRPAALRIAAPPSSPREVHILTSPALASLAGGSSARRHRRRRRWRRPDGRRGAHCTSSAPAWSRRRGRRDADSADSAPAEDRGARSRSTAAPRPAMPTPCRAPPRRAAPLRCAAPLSTASLIAPPQSAPPPLVSPLPAEARPAQPHTTLSAALLCFAPRSPSPPSDAPRPCLVTGCGWSAPGARGRLITGWLRVREGARAAGYTPLRTATLVCTAPHHAPLLCAAPRRPTPLSAVSCLAPPLPASHLRPSRSPGPSAAPHLAAPCRPRPTIPACPCGARFTQPPLRRRIGSAHLTFPPAQPRRTPLCRNAPARSPPLPCSLVSSSSRLAFRSLPPSPPSPRHAPLHRRSLAPLASSPLADLSCTLCYTHLSSTPLAAPRRSTPPVSAARCATQHPS